MREKTLKLNIKYRDGINAGARKLEQMKPHLERMINGDLAIEQHTAEDHRGEEVLLLQVPRSCGRHGIIGILNQFGFRQV